MKYGKKRKGSQISKWFKISLSLLSKMVMIQQQENNEDNEGRLM